VVHIDHAVGLNAVEAQDVVIISGEVRPVSSPQVPRFEVPKPALGETRLQQVRSSIRVLSATSDQTLVHFGGLLSPAECKGLMKEARDRLVTATTTVGGQLEVHGGRTAASFFFPLGASARVRRIEKRVEALFNWNIADTEGIQIQRYGQGGQYLPHYDYFDGVAPPLRGEGPRRQRVATLLMYLSMPAKGGDTHFLERGLRFAPVPGDGVFFSYDHPSPETRTLHEGCVVEEGEKWVVNVWFRERLEA
jgi:prolyl 4-hydroxylase